MEGVKKGTIYDRFKKLNYIVNCDYLEFSVEGFYNNVHDFGVITFKKGNRWEDIREFEDVIICSNPKGFNKGRNIHLLKVKNHLFYENSFDIQIYISLIHKYFLRGFSFSINRFDLCIDYIDNSTINACSEFRNRMIDCNLHHVQRYSMHINKKYVETVCAGSRTSKTFIRSYNKSLELKNSKKHYIVKFLSKNLGQLEEGQFFMRLEFQLRDINLKAVDDLQKLFQVLYNKYMFSKKERDAQGADLNKLEMSMIFKPLTKNDTTYSFSVRQFKNLLGYISKYQGVHKKDIRQFDIDEFVKDYKYYVTLNRLKL